MKKYGGVLLLVVSLLVMSPTKLFSQYEEEDNRILNEFIVMLKPDHSVEQLLKDVPSLKIKESLSPDTHIHLLERNTTASAEDFLFTLQQNEHVKLAQFNHHVEPRSLVPNDTSFFRQWNMFNTGQGGTPGADIDAIEAWAISNDALTVNGDSIVIAIIDDKVDLNHPDLNIYTNYREIPGNGMDDDHNGFIDDVHGYNTGANNGSTLGGNDHTMHCSGIAAAKGNNTTGVAGVCWGAKILPVVYGLSASEFYVFKAYDYVRTMRLIYNNSSGSQGAFIVSTNTSFGVNNGNPINFPVWCAMYDLMGRAGILSAAATANSNVDVDAVHDMPTECSSKYLISVTNTTQADLRNTTIGAAYGKTSIDLGAPGTAIYSTVSIAAGSYGYNTGTSMSSPHVAGAVAAIYSAACKGFIDACYIRPDSIPILVKKYLLDGVEWNSSLNNITLTNGRLNLLRAILNLKKFDCDSCNFNIGINKIPISCKSVNDGSMTVTVDSGSILDYNILWSNGVDSFRNLNVEPGFYTVRVTDTINGCSRFATAELHYPDTIIIQAINVIATGDSANGNITIVASAGNGALNYSIDGINYQQTATFSIDTNGPYTVYVRNTSGCVVQQNVVVSSVDELTFSSWQLTVYPNPADEQLTVYCLQFPIIKLPLQVFDLSGRLLYVAEPTTTNHQLLTANFESGVYFLRYGNTTRKFAVMH